MKINEVIVEALNTGTGTPNADPANSAGANAFGNRSQPASAKKPSLWDRVKKGARGAVAGYQQTKANREAGIDNKVSNELVGRELQSWQTFLGQFVAGHGGNVTPQLLQQAATQFTTNRYRLAGPAILGKVNTVTDSKSANAFITQAFNMAMANQKSGATPEPIDTTNANATVTGKEQLSRATGGWITTPDGIQIKPASGRNPTFARYNKQLYRLTNDDRWVDVRDKPVSQTMTAALNNALEQT